MAGLWLLDLTLPTPAENVALDEALLLEAEEAGEPHETLRLWEPAQVMAVVGRGSRATEDLHQEACQAQGVPILRRTSGGLSILTGPGCLMYSVVLSLELRPHLKAVDQAHNFVLGTVCRALQPLVPGIARQGTSDLTLGPRKVSGNSLQLKRRAMLYHGTLLYNFPLELIEKLLAMPPRSPDYRAGRDHRDFIANLPTTSQAMRKALAETWQAQQPRTDWPADRVKSLVAEQYSQDAWNLRR